MYYVHARAHVTGRDRSCAHAHVLLLPYIDKMAKRGETDDLATLASLDETILLQELKRRYEQDKIYVSLLREIHFNDS